MKYIDDIENIQQQLFMTQELENKDGYSWTLASRLGEALHLAEQKFGERDKSYTVLGVEFVVSGRPQIWYPGNRKHIVIQLTKEALYEECQAIYQLAHETIHLLSPLEYNNANILEEGLATYFSEWYLKTLKLPNLQPCIKEYHDALDLTNTLLSIDYDIIKKVRKIEPTISHLTKDHFYQVNPDISEELLSKLCSKFKDI